MGMKDYVNSFNAPKYTATTKGRPTEELRKHEVRKLRQIIGASASIGVGVGGAAFTAGATLGAAALGGRRLYVAKRKLNIIENELRSRGIELHKMQAKDFVVPVAAVAVGAGVGFGLEELVMLGTNEIAQAASIQSSGGTIGNLSDITQHPDTFFEGMGEGIQQQAHEMAFALHETANGVFPGTHDFAYDLAGDTVWNSVSPAEAIGFHYGMLIATSAERGLAAAIGSELMWRVLESMEGTMKAAKYLPCRRMAGTPIVCECCEKAIDKGMFYHCCACNDDVDICRNCYDDGKRCKSQYHKLRFMQVALSEEYNVVKQADGYWHSDRNVTCRADVRALDCQAECDTCQNKISQGYVMHCMTCEIVDICPDCYREGQTCNDKYSHALTAVSCRLDLTKKPFAVRDCLRSLGTMNTNVITCEACARGITQGRYYHCCECLEDNYDVCHACYIGGKGCTDERHTMQLHLVADRAHLTEYLSTCARRSNNDPVADKLSMLDPRRCDRCKDNIAKGYFYHCCKCNNDTFDMCSNCYSEGNGCNDITHSLTLHSLG